MISERIIDLLRDVQFRGKTRLLNPLCPKSGVRHARVFGSMFECDCADFIQRQIYLGAFEPHETRLARQYLQPGMTFVDAGANVGYYTALASRQVQGNGGRVVAFEPSPYAHERLSKMVHLNRLQHVTTVQAALAEQPGRSQLYLGVGSQNHTPTMVAHQNAIATEIAVSTLDLEAGRLGIERIDLLKIDVEGYEPKVLGGATRLMQERRIHAILCEFNEGWLREAGSSSQELTRLLQAASFVEVLLQNASENRFFRLS